VFLDGIAIKTMSVGTDFKEFNDELQKSLVAATRAVNQLCAEDLGFHKSLDPNVGKALDNQNGRFVKLAERLIRSAALGSEGVGEPLSLDTVEAVDNNWHSIVDTIDSLLERAATSIDQYTGTIKRVSPGQVCSR
jgi:exosome complex exonuclease RRP6